MCGKAPCDKADCTWSEQYRAQSEARVVMRWPKEKRQAYYQKVAQARGEAAARALAKEVKRQWELAK